MSGFIHWLRSATVRQALAMANHVQKLLDHQRDLLVPAGAEKVCAAILEVRQAAEAGSDKAELETRMRKLEDVAGKWLKPYPNATLRENIEVLLVALAVAMAIRTFFLQPFKIPTGSMQPTLFGVTSTNLLDAPDFKPPTGWAAVRSWFAGETYLHKVAASDGVLEAVSAPVGLPFFYFWQTLVVGGQTYTIWLPPDYGDPRSGSLQARAGLVPQATFHKGEDIIKLQVNAGDHLFVDRLTYNFRPPERGEIVVFETSGIPEDMRTRWWIPGDQFYIKRLVALGDDCVQISTNRHLVINGKPLDASTPHFEHIYSFNPNEPPRESHYSGHVSLAGQGSFFDNKPEGVHVRPNHYMVMGDNTMNSLDSRYWGDFPASAVIGRSFFVYWPITDRFGWGYHR